MSTPSVRTRVLTTRFQAARGTLDVGSRPDSLMKSDSLIFLSLIPDGETVWPCKSSRALQSCPRHPPPPERRAVVRKESVYCRGREEGRGRDVDGLALGVLMSCRAGRGPWRDVELAVRNDSLSSLATRAILVHTRDATQPTSRLVSSLVQIALSLNRRVTFSLASLAASEDPQAWSLY